jgi:ATP-dependent DNA helicase RecG
MYPLMQLCIMGYISAVALTSSDPRQREALAAIERLLSGEPPDHVEGTQIECKEDPSGRDRMGVRTATLPQSAKTAQLLTDAAAAIANAEGGAVLLGVSDKADDQVRFPGTSADGSWLCERVWANTGEQRGGIRLSCVEHGVEGRRLLVFLVDASPHPVPSHDGRYRQRVGRSRREIPPTELGYFSLSRAQSDWGSQTSAFSVGDAHPAAIEQLREYLMATREENRITLASQDVSTMLRTLGLLDAESRLLNSGALLTVREDRPSALIDLIGRESIGGSTIQRIDRTDLSLIEQIARVEAALELLIPEVSVSSGTLQLSRLRRLPITAVREALINAVAHRDWRLQRPIMVIAEGDRLTVASPGGFLPGIDADNVLTAQPKSRNPVLTRALRSLRLAEAEGSGVDGMYRDMIRLGHEPPELTEVEHGTAVRCVLNGGTPRLGRLRILSALPSDVQVNVDLAITLWALAARPTLTPRSLASLLQKPRKEAADALELAGRHGIVVRTTRDGMWRLADPHRESLGEELPYLRRSAATNDDLIRAHLKDHEDITRRDVIEMANVSETQAGRMLSKAVDRGVIKLPDGGPQKGRNVHYVAVDLG